MTHLQPEVKASQGVKPLLLEYIECHLQTITDSQPMTPPVVAIHDAGTHLYQIDSAASIQLREIAENGNNMPRVELAASMDTVSASGVAFVDASAPWPFFPGETASIILQTGSADQVFSAVNMIVCTNDGFAGTDSDT
ncbi:MAG: spondin domain-containing protein [Granulosicoccus sp.]